jgi:hypothetical protein
MCTPRSTATARIRASQEKQMSTMFKKLARQVLLCAGLCVAGQGGATQVTISFDREDVADTTPGVDRWVHHYRMTGPLRAFYLSSLLFDSQRFDELALSNISSGDVSGDVVQPIQLLAADGLVQMTALDDLDEGFWVRFDVQFSRLADLGNTQPFEVLDDTFEFVYAGTARLNEDEPGTVPSPGTPLLLAAALLPLLLSRRRRA